MSLDFFQRLATGQVNAKGSIRPRPQNPFAATTTAGEDDAPVLAKQPESPAAEFNRSSQTSSLVLPPASSAPKESPTADSRPGLEPDHTIGPPPGTVMPNRGRSHSTLAEAPAVSDATSQEQIPSSNRQEPPVSPINAVQPSGSQQLTCDTPPPLDSSSGQDRQTIITMKHQADADQQEMEETHTTASLEQREIGSDQSQNSRINAPHRTIRTLSSARIGPAKEQQYTANPSPDERIFPSEEKQPATIEISIGRIVLQPEPRSIPTQEVHHRFEPPLTLDSYLEQRNRGTG